MTTSGNTYIYIYKNKKTRADAALTEICGIWLNRKQKKNDEKNLENFVSSLVGEEKQFGLSVESALSLPTSLLPWLASSLNAIVYLYSCTEGKGKKVGQGKKGQEGLWFHTVLLCQHLKNCPLRISSLQTRTLNRE